MASTATTDNPSDDWAYAVGDVFQDRYEIYERVARGAFGEVHAARDTAEDRRVALKILRTESERRDPKAVARIRQEAEILRALDHPNLVQVHDMARADGRECLVMELLEGRSLRERIDEGPPASLHRVQRVVRQILSALEAMHRRGVQHRDLKPDNIILLSSPDDSREPTVKLVDFGIAKARNFLDQDHEQTLVETQEKNVVGTPKYSSPEQAVGDPLDASSDLFSVGLVVAEWFTGEPRIDEPDSQGVVSVLIQPDPLEVSDCPESWQPWLRKTLAKKPDERFRSANRAREALPESGRSADRDPLGRASPGEPAAPHGSSTPNPPLADTDDNPTVESPEPPAEPTVVETASNDPGQRPRDAKNAAARSAPSDRPDRESGAVDPRETPSSLRSRARNDRHDIDVDGETARPSDPSADDQSTPSIWFTVGSILLFALSLSLFVYTLFEALT